MAEKESCNASSWPSTGGAGGHQNESIGAACSASSLSKESKLDILDIQHAIRRKYADVSATSANKFNYPTGKEGAVLQGYDLNILVNMPDELIESFCGVGNPFTLGPINPGETVLDIGCGAGFDLIVASHMVGQRGKVCGIDLTPEMLEKARRNLVLIAASAYDVRVAGTEEIPYDEGTFDLVISNGVLNLSPLKEKSFREIYRVLKPAGRLQFADIVLKEGTFVSGSNSLEAWSNWIGGAVSVGDLINLIKSVGFIHAEYMRDTSVSTSPLTVGGLLRASKAPNK